MFDIIKMHRGETTERGIEMEHSIKEYSETIFENIKHVNEYGQEFWYAREIQEVLEYKRWDKFTNVIEKAKAACANSENVVEDHFSHVGKMVDIGSGAGREVED